MESIKIYSPGTGVYRDFCRGWGNRKSLITRYEASDRRKQLLKLCRKGGFEHSSSENSSAFGGS